MNLINTQLTINTFKNGAGHVSNIDHVLVKENHITQIVSVNVISSEKEIKHLKSCITLEQINEKNRLNWDPMNTSDHRAILIEFDMDIIIENVGGKAKKVQINWESPKEIKDYSEILEAKLSNSDLNGRLDELGHTKEGMESIIETLSNIIKEAKNGAIRKKNNTKIMHQR